MALLKGYGKVPRLHNGRRVSWLCVLTLAFAALLVYYIWHPVCRACAVPVHAVIIDVQLLIAGCARAAWPWLRMPPRALEDLVSMQMCVLPCR